MRDRERERGRAKLLLTQVSDASCQLSIHLRLLLTVGYHKTALFTILFFLLLIFPDAAMTSNVCARRNRFCLLTCVLVAAVVTLFELYNSESAWYVILTDGLVKRTSAMFVQNRTKPKKRTRQTHEDCLAILMCLCEYLLMTLFVCALTTTTLR